MTFGERDPNPTTPGSIGEEDKIRVEEIEEIFHFQPPVISYFVNKKVGLQKTFRAYYSSVS